MPILSIQRQMRTLGRIRTGNQITSKGGKRIPNKLETFRLTSESRDMVEAAAAAYGGVVAPWTNPGASRPQFEVVTTATALDIVVPPGQPVSQWLELWTAGGCQRRCDGETNVLDMSPCACPSDVEQRLALAAKGEACKTTTRLNVILPALPDLGVWMLESHGFYAAVELAGAAEVLAMAAQTGRLIPARLRLEQREKRIPGKPTRQYAVPIIEFTTTRMADLRIAGPGAPQLAAGPPAIPALPAIAPPASSDLRAPLANVGPRLLTAPELQALIKGGTVAVETAGAIFRERFPNAKSLLDLDDEERGSYWQECVAAAAQPAETGTGG